MDKREKIKLSAIKLFSTKGFQATSTTSITSHAQVGTGTLFLYFNSKEQMINQIYLEVKDEIATYLLSMLSEQKTTRSKFKRLWECMINWATENPDKFLFVQQFNNSPFINNLTREEAVGAFRFLFQIIEEGEKQDILKPIDPEFLYAFIHGHIFSTINYLRHNPFKLQVVTEFSFEMIWKAMSA
jgi:AcrR family transcriptional regulator